MVLVHLMDYQGKTLFAIKSKSLYIDYLCSRFLKWSHFMMLWSFFFFWDVGGYNKVSQVPTLLYQEGPKEGMFPHGCAPLSLSGCVCLFFFLWRWLLSSPQYGLWNHGVNTGSEIKVSIQALKSLSIQALKSGFQYRLWNHCPPSSPLHLFGVSWWVGESNFFFFFE